MDSNVPGCDDPDYDDCHAIQPGICGYIDLTTIRCNKLLKVCISFVL